MLILTGFLNFISSLYSDVDISKVDLSLVNRKKKRVKKILYIIKNSYFLFIGICVILVFFHIILSRIIIDDLFRKFLLEDLSFSANKFWNKDFWWLPEMIVALFLASFTEILVRYLADRDFAKRRIFNPFLLDFTYVTTRIVSFPLKWMIKEKRISNYKERDLIRLMSNLEAENILEPQEARLIRAAFRFDDEEVNKIFCPRRKVIFLLTSMNFKEIQNIYYKHHFTRYPVLTENKEIFGILNFKTLNLNMYEKEDDWKEFVNKKVIYIPLSTKLNVVLDTLQKNHEHLAIIVEKGKFVGIITLEDVLENLVGEIHDENEIKGRDKSKN